MTPEEKIEQLGLQLPKPRPAVGTYVGCVRVGNIIFTAGQGGGEYHGKVGRGLTVEEGYKAGRQSMLNLRSAVKAEISDLSIIKQVVKRRVMVNSAEGC